MEKFSDSGFGNIIKNPQEGGGGFNSVFEGLKKRKAAALELIENTSFEQKVVNREEISKLLEVSEFLKLFVSRHGKETSRGVLDNLVSELNNSDFWNDVFRTGDGGFDDKTDSFYYLSPSHLSLRLKTANLPNGLESVVQPFNEIIVFEKDGQISENPKMGYTVSEFLSKDFLNLQKTSSSTVGDFISPLKFHKSLGTVDIKQEFFKHLGHEVSKIDFSNKHKKYD